MGDNQTVGAPPAAPDQGPAQPERKPYGPGPLMVFGLALLAVGAWCGKDFFFPPEAWVKEQRSGWVWMNGAAMVAAVIAAVYSFVLAYIRAKNGPEPDG
jgi:hypothetical protein